MSKPQRDYTVIVEKAPCLRDEGYMIDFFGSGYDVAERSGIVKELETIHYPIERFSFLDANGTEKYSFAYTQFRQLFDNRHFNFMRGDLERVLYSQVREGVEIRFGTTIRWLQHEGQMVRAEFSSGCSEYFDLVIGADGVHSGVRELCFGEESRFLRSQWDGQYRNAVASGHPALHCPVNVS